MRCGCAMHQRCGGGDMALGASFRRPGIALSGAHFVGQGATRKRNDACSHVPQHQRNEIVYTTLHCTCLPCDMLIGSTNHAVTSSPPAFRAYLLMHAQVVDAS